LTSRLAASGVKFVGKLATTSTRYGSATSRRAVVLLDRLYWLRRYFWITLAIVVGQVRQSRLDLPRLRPDLRRDELLVEVGEVHRMREVLAEADWVDDRETNLPGGSR